MQGGLLVVPLPFFFGVSVHIFLVEAPPSIPRQKRNLDSKQQAAAAAVYRVLYLHTRSSHRQPIVHLHLRLVFSPWSKSTHFRTSFTVMLLKYCLGNLPALSHIPVNNSTSKAHLDSPHSFHSLLLRLAPIVHFRTGGSSDI
ncbi:hypothetical protein GGR58DRAFT_72970 [Xylaria digitata]|nr:hypothetical protein GGR58DRAFT_72970 [Xylaria digitata]